MKQITLQEGLILCKKEIYLTVKSGQVISTF